MRFDHRYKYKGVLYEAGQEVPIEKDAPKKEGVAKEVKKTSHLFPAEPEATEEKPKRKGRPPKAKE